MIVYLLFLIVLVWIVIKMVALAAKMAWGIGKILFGVILFPLFLVGMVYVGLICIVFPIAIIVGIVLLLSK